MKATQIERLYPVAPHVLFGTCLTALGQMRARVERHDVERGTIVAATGGSLGAAAELSLRISAVGGQARLLAVAQSRGRGDPRVLATLIQLIDGLLAPPA